MKAKTAKLIAALQVELAAAIATKEAASEAMDKKLFDAAVIRISDIEASQRLAALQESWFRKMWISTALSNRQRVPGVRP